MIRVFMRPIVVFYYENIWIPATGAEFWSQHLDRDVNSNIIDKNGREGRC